MLVLVNHLPKLPTLSSNEESEFIELIAQAERRPPWQQFSDLLSSETSELKSTIVGFSMQECGVG